MKASEITFDNMVRKLPEALPELRARFDEEKDWLEEESLHYLYYNFVLYKHIEALLKGPKADEKSLRRAFDFSESLLRHTDSRVREVIEDTVYDSICSDEVVLQKAQRYLGDLAKRYCAFYMGQGPDPFPEDT